MPRICAVSFLVLALFSGLLLPLASARGAGTDPSPQRYEQYLRTGGLHTAGRVFMHQDNTNYSPGNNWWSQGLNNDPAAQWPGYSGTEYLRYMSLLVAGKDRDGIRRCDALDEIRAVLPAWAITRQAYEGSLGGQRDMDDDGDQALDEDFLNGKDDDADGRVDEDFAAISPEMLADEMTDYTPAAISDESHPERHVPLGLRVRLTSYAWEGAGARNFIGIHYEITNDTRQLLGGAGRDIDSVYVGELVRSEAGPRENGDPSTDDIVGAMEIAVDGVTSPDDLRHDAYHPDRPAREEQILRIFYGVDNDGDGGRTPGAGALVLLGATQFPRLGFKRLLSADDVASDDYGNAPRYMGRHAYRYFRNGVSYSQGGVPVVDAELYDAMSNAGHSDVSFPDPENTASYKSLISVGPYITLPADSSIGFDLAFAVGEVDYNPRKPFPADFTELTEFSNKFGRGERSMLAACREAWTAWRGELLASPVPLGDGFKCSKVNDPREPGGTLSRETCILSAPGHHDLYADCRDPGGDPRETGDLHCTWFDLDCDPATGVCDRSGRPELFRRPWVGSSPPAPPRMVATPLEHAVRISWNDISEKIVDPGTRQLDFKGYRLYRAVGWKRDTPTGSNGPANDLWQLLGDWAIDRPEIHQPAAAGFLWQVRDKQNFPDDSTSSVDSTQGCILADPAASAACRVHKVGYYSYLDRNVINGFRYFYVVSAYDLTQRDAVSQASPIDKYESHETGLSANEDAALVPRTDCAGDLGHVKVVPNPYRFRAAWDLRPNGPDPTGTHINFNHLPCGRFTLRIFSLAGDLIQSFHESDARNNGGTVEWNLISRNGQDIKSGIYVYSIESSRFGHTVGRFTIIR